MKKEKLDAFQILELEYMAYHKVQDLLDELSNEYGHKFSKCGCRISVDGENMLELEEAVSKNKEKVELLIKKKAERD